MERCDRPNQDAVENIRVSDAIRSLISEYYRLGGTPEEVDRIVRTEATRHYLETLDPRIIDTVIQHVAQLFERTHYHDIQDIQREIMPLVQGFPDDMSDRLQDIFTYRNARLMEHNNYLTMAPSISDPKIRQALAVLLARRCKDAYFRKIIPMNQQEGVWVVDEYAELDHLISCIRTGFAKQVEPSHEQITFEDIMKMYLFGTIDTDDTYSGEYTQLVDVLRPFLSTRAYNVLKRADVRTVAQLYKLLDSGGLNSLRNGGDAFAAECIKALDDFSNLQVPHS